MEYLIGAFWMLTGIITIGFLVYILGSIDELHERVKKLEEKQKGGK